MRIVLGVSGGIAAYKAAHLLRLFREDGHQVDVVPTPAALEFVGRPTWEALSGHPVTASVFEGVSEVRHVRLGQEADLVVVAPATADLLARVRAGLADDLLTSTLLVSEAPVLLVPAMHTEMWQNSATQENVEALRRRGLEIMDPAVGRLTGKDSGPGRLPEPEDIKARADEWLAGSESAAEADGWHLRSPRTGMEPHPGAGRVQGAPDGPPIGPLTGRRVVVTAGGTREPLDPVRYLGNRSSGKQGIALAQEAAAQGAEVLLIAGAIEAEHPRDVPVNLTIEGVETAQQLQKAVQQEAHTADMLIMAAAVADFRPADYAEAKIKKGDGEDPVIPLVRNPDILAGAVRHRAETGDGPEVIVGFAAETGDGSTDPLELAEQKLARKGCDLLVLNRVGEGLVFGQDDTEIHVLSSPEAQRALRSAETSQLRGTKAQAAQLVLEQAARLLAVR